MAPILNRTPLAAISFKDGNGAHIRVYYQDTEGFIRETFYDDKVGWNKRDKDIIGKGKLNTGIAAIQWAQGTQIRVYFLAPDNSIVERCYNGGAAGSWFDGALTGKVHAAPYSDIGAVPFSLGQYDIRVYYQSVDNKIREAVLNPGAESWSTNDPGLPLAIPSSSISAVSSTNRPGQRVWVYFQQANTVPVEYQLLDSAAWKLGGYKPTGTFAPGAGISAVHFGDYHIRVLAVNEQNTLVQTEWNKSGGWGSTKNIVQSITYSGVATIDVPTVESWIRVYQQPSGQTISEEGSNDGGSSYITSQSAIPVDH